MKTPEVYSSRIAKLIDAVGVETHLVNRIQILVTPDRNVMGLLAGLLALWRLALNALRRKTLKLARAPSQEETWETIASELEPGDLDADSTLATFMDEIRDQEYEQLWQRSFVQKAPDGVLANAHMIQFGDGSETHAKAEAGRGNQVLDEWNTEDTYTLSIGGTSPTFDNGPSECHIAFHSEDTPGDTVGPYMAIPMSAAGSRQQEHEGVVSAADSIDSDWVVSMTAYTLTQETDDLIMVLPEDRGINLYRMLHESPDTLPAAQIQRHRRLEASASEERPSVIVVTTRKSWDQYLAKAKAEAAA